MWDVTSALREPLSPEQEHLLRAIYEPFDQSGEWPIWQYVDLTLARRRLRPSRFGVPQA